MVRASRRAGVPVLHASAFETDGPKALCDSVRSGVPRPAAFGVRGPQCITSSEECAGGEYDFPAGKFDAHAGPNAPDGEFSGGRRHFGVSDLNPHPDSAAEEIVPGAELNDVVVSSGRLSDGAAFVSGAGANSSSVAASCQI